MVAVGGEYFWSLSFHVDGESLHTQSVFHKQKEPPSQLYRSVGLVERVKIDWVHKPYPPEVLHELSRFGGVGRPFSISSSGSSSNENLLCPSASCARQCSALKLFGIQTLKSVCCGVRET